MEQVKEQIKRITEEYEAKRIELKKVYETKLREVCVPYAIKIARFKVGQIIDHLGRIFLIEKIGATIVKGDVYPAYSGPLLTKALKKAKRGYEVTVTDFDTELKLIK